MTANQLPPITRAQLLERCQTEGDRLQEISLALGAIAGILRKDAGAKSDDPESGLSMAELDGLAIALTLIADRTYERGDSLETMARVEQAKEMAA